MLQNRVLENPRADDSVFQEGVFKHNFAIPLLAVMEKTRSGLSGRLPIRVSKSCDDLLSPSNDFADEKPYVLNSEFLIVPPSGRHDKDKVISNGKKPPYKRYHLLKSKTADLRPNYKPENNRVWKYWEAALLLSKWEDEKKQEASSYLRREDINFVKDIVQKGCCCKVCCSSSEEGCCETPYMTAKAVAALTSHAITSVDLRMLEDTLPAIKYDEVRYYLFSGVAWAVLSIFDMEDFKRIYNREEVQKEYEVLWSRLRDLNCDPNVAFAEGLVKCDDLSNLSEHDFCHMLNQYQEAMGNVDIKVSPYFLLDELEADISESDIYTAAREMTTYTPLKDVYKTELTLELTSQKCYHVFDSLVINTLNWTPLEALWAYVPHSEKSFRDKCKADHFRCMKEEASKAFIEGIINGLHRLAALKCSMLKHVKHAIKSSLDKLNSGTNGVVQLLMIADNERRKESSRVIGLQHMLFGLSVSRYGYHSSLLRSLGDRASNFSFMKLYKSACVFASGRQLTLLHLMRAIILHEKNPSTRVELEVQILDEKRNEVELKIWESKRFQHTTWKDRGIFSRFQIEWNTSTGARLLCSSREFVEMLDSNAKVFPRMFQS